MTFGTWELAERLANAVENILPDEMEVSEDFHFQIVAAIRRVLLESEGR